MNLASVVILVVIAAAFIAALNYTRKNGSCAGCSGKKAGGCGGNCGSCAMKPLEDEMAAQMKNSQK